MTVKTTKRGKGEAIRPINEWVRKALAHTSKSNADVARELHARGLSGTVDRSLPGKMAAFRDVSADEMFAIAEITGYPLPADEFGSPIEGEDEIKAILRRIKGLPSTAVQPVYRVIAGFIEDASSKS